MIKEEKILAEKIERHKYCDVCGKEIHIGLAGSRANCEYCGKDLCDKCIGYEENTMGDYRKVYCKKCWTIGKKYKPIIEQHENEIDRLYAEWQYKCRN